MEIVNDKDIITIEKDGKKVDCEVLFTFDCEENGKSYVGYTDGEIDSNGRKTIYVSSFNPLNMEISLESITDQRELDMINDVLQQIDRESNNY